MAIFSGDKRKFDSWAKDYDADAKTNTWVAPGLLLEDLLKFISIDSRMSAIDVGCGTGISGNSLRGAGIAKLDGADYSKNMLNKARKKDLYDNLYEIDASSESEIRTIEKKYDLVFSCGMIGDVAAMRETLPNLAFLAKDTATLAFCGYPRYGLENVEFMSMMLAQADFKLVSAGNYFAYRLGGTRKNYIYCIAQRD